jgi:CheY-like chemotaxis protein
MDKKKKILIVDDTEFNRDLVVQLLEDEFELVIAADGAQGLKQTERARPAAMIICPSPSTKMNC